MQLAITQAHEKVVTDLKSSGLEYRVVRPCGYFSDMGVLYDMAAKGRSFLVGDGSNKMNPIHGADLADFIVTAGEIDGVGPQRGTTTLRSYFEMLKDEN